MSLKLQKRRNLLKNHNLLSSVSTFWTGLLMSISLLEEALLTLIGSCRIYCLSDLSASAIAMREELKSDLTFLVFRSVSH